MVDGLQAAAEMADLVAATKEKEADRRVAQKDLSGAAAARAVAREMEGFAGALRSRAAAMTTGDWRPIGGDPGPGWRRRKRATPAEGSHTRKIRVRRHKWWVQRLLDRLRKSLS